MLFFGTLFMYAQEGRIDPLSIRAITELKDSITPPTLINKAILDTITSDSTQVDSLQKKEPLLLDKIKYKAKDYVKLSQKDKKIYLYNKAEIYYLDTELKAGVIIMDYIKNEVYAGRIKDSLGNYTQLPYFKQGDNEVTPDSIRFNFDTQKAIIWNSRTEQQAGLGQLGSDNMKVYAEITKKENDSVYFLHHGKLTTSKDTVNPDYYIKIKKAKFVPGKKVIAGFSNLHIVDVPTPIAMPFAYFPLTVGRSAGLMMPSFGNDPNRGYFIQNGGYYFPLGEHVDLLLTGDLYTNGSWGFRGQSIYTKRYKYRGNVNFRYENLVSSQKGFDDYSRTTIYNLQISHSQDAKSNPNSRFSASVNLGSSQYYRNSLNVINTPNTQNNNLSSSISYSKTFPTYPSVNLSVTATHNQNTNTKAINMTLPTFQGSMERIYPFAKKDGIKKGIIQNVNFQYSLRASNRIQTTDDEFFKPGMFEKAKSGARHTIPISTNFKVAKHFSVSMGTSYEDVWTLQTYKRGWDSESNKEVVLDTVRSFDRYGKYNFSTSIGTTVYGTYAFGEDKKIQAIRHVMRPSLSYSTAPSFEQYYEDLLDETGNQYLDRNGEVVRYSKFEGSLNGAPGGTKASSMSFSLQNTLEAKVRDKDSTALEPKKVSILNSFNLSSSYNFQADSLKLSPVRLSGGTNVNLFDKPMNISFGATMDPYAIDNNGTRVNTFNIDNGGSLVRLTRANLSLSYSLSSDIFNKKEDDKEKKEEDSNSYRANSGGRTDDLFGVSEEYNNDPRDNEKKSGDIENPIYSTTIPWDLRLAFNTNYNNSNRQNEFSSASLMFSGNIELSPRWKLGASSSYDFKNIGFGLTQLRLQRDLKSFVMRFNWTPFGTYKQWNFFIGINASILSDLKWESRSQRSRR